MSRAEGKLGHGGKTPLGGKHKRSVIWSGLQNTTARLYKRILRCPVGRFFTAYRSFDKGILGGGRRTDKMGAASAARVAMLRTAESGRLFSVLRKVGQLLLSVPVNFYGLFCFISAALALMAYYIIPLTPFNVAFGISDPITLIAIVLASLPLCLSGKHTYRVLYESRVMNILLVRFLGIPEDSLKRQKALKGAGWMYLLFFLIPLAAFVSLMYDPLYVPLFFLFVGVVAMILSFPESGVILACATTPLLWFEGISLYVTLALIITVWLSYLLKLWRMHRVMRFDTLDIAVLVFGIMIFAGGFIGPVAGRSTIHSAIVLFVLMSIYFLIVNLMAGRAYLKRCLVGVLLSVTAATVLGFAGYISPDGMSWIAGSYAGDKISGVWTEAVGYLAGINADVILLVTVTLPFALAAFFRCKRLVGKAGMLALIAADIALIVMSWSRGAWFCLAAGLIIFFLLYGHTALSVAVISVPVLGCGILWGSFIARTLKFDLGAVMSRVLNLGAYGASITAERQDVWSGAWRMIAENPFGIGVGTDAIRAVYPTYAVSEVAAVTTLGNTYLDVAACMGIFGLLVFAVCAFLLIQKVFSALRYTATGKERWALLGGVVSVLTLLMMGAVRSITESMSVYFAVWIIVAVISAYANITFENSDILCSVSEAGESSQDKVFNTAE